MAAMTCNVARLDDRDDDERLHRWRSEHDPAEVIRHLCSWVKTRRRWEFAGEPPGVDRLEVHLLHRTRLFRFTDDVFLSLSPDGGGAVVDAVSRSRIGKGDLGQNRRNLLDLRRGIVGVG